MLTCWADATRDELSALAPRALAVLPVAAIEQHGPHLPTDADLAIVAAVASRACELVAHDADVVLLPPLAFGSSNHHLPFGGTLSLAPATMAAVLADLLRSIAQAGFPRALLVNGHGGNAELCATAAERASAAGDVVATAVSYWHLLGADAEVPAPTPGHAGAFETSLMLHLAPERVRMDRARPSPGTIDQDARGVADAGLWRRIDGFTDDPRRADARDGARVLAAVADALAHRIRALAG
jgi:creatinine amidohydrolase